MEVYNIAQVCDILGIGKSTLHHWWRVGRGPARTKIGHRVFITKDNLEKWLDSCEEHYDK